MMTSSSLPPQRPTFLRRGGASSASVTGEEDAAATSILGTSLGESLVGTSNRLFVAPSHNLKLASPRYNSASASDSRPSSLASTMDVDEVAEAALVEANAPEIRILSGKTVIALNLDVAVNNHAYMIIYCRLRAAPIWSPVTWKKGGRYANQ